MRSWHRILTVFVVLAASLVAVTPARAGINGLARKPYLGWSSWSLESTNYPGVNPTGSASWLTEAHVLQQADVLAAKLRKFGYEYVNVDAGWVGGYDAYGRPVAKASTFPHGMKYVGDHVHGKGLKYGLYLAVGLDPGEYNDGRNQIYGAPQCHTSDIVYPDLRKTNGWDSAYKIDFGNPCAQLYVNSLADQLASWGADFLKLDGVGPGSFKGGANYDNTADVAAWAAALKQTGRPIEFTVSWSLAHSRADVWKHYSNGWRIDTDVECYCDTLVTWNNSVDNRFDDVVQWIDDAGPGHWNNLDSLNVGSGQLDGITEAERQSYATLWAIESSPLYVGDDLTRLDDFGMSLLTNPEVIAIDQAGRPAKPVDQYSPRQTWFVRNSDGSLTVALFNLGNNPARVTADWDDLGIVGAASVRDVWRRADIGTANGSFGADLPVHGSRLLRITPHSGLSKPTGLRGTGSTATSVSLSWDGAGWHDVFAGNMKVASVQGSAATVSGLRPATTYDFSVRARNSLRSKAISITTPAAGGPTSYEAEAFPIAGSANVYDCGGCSGGKKVGYLGGSGNGTVTYDTVTAPKDGTYLMRVSYVDGDSSRHAIVTVDGEPVDLPTAGTGDNDWNNPQTLVMPVRLTAGVNTISFGNPGDNIADIDRIAV
ncbi:fibronectin type III domain-containing protein [Fodinicola acaciae]|uniref:fibronectin type III domain-containing protein n=1 Tax=Fodinicola acaciae TaxID=2681555 RepID=UPI0013D84622|nr:hypothetical protein [Fodinicola acaciae]